MRLLTPTSGMQADFRRALSDVDHVLRFWDPKFVERDQPVPMSIPDLYMKRLGMKESAGAYYNLFAKAWLLRG